jgi:hypothetical protein
VVSPFRAATLREHPLRTIEPGGGPFGIVACSGTFSLAMATIDVARQLPDQSKNSLGGIFSTGDSRRRGALPRTDSTGR